MAIYAGLVLVVKYTEVNAQLFLTIRDKKSCLKILMIFFEFNKFAFVLFIYRNDMIYCGIKRKISTDNLLI